jgi:ferredoxin
MGRVGDTGRPTPTAEVLRMIDELEGSIAVGPCRCRIAHYSCDHPLETDIVIRTGVEAWTRAFPKEYRLIGKDEAKRIVSECQRAGLWQMVFVHCPVNEENEYVICNCCECGCVPYIVNQELGQRVYPLLHGHFEAGVMAERCTGHGTCVDACPFDVLGMADGKARLVGTCLGCGRCVDACLEGAI